jgi:hypothetical protein
MKLFYNALLLGVSLQLSCYLLWGFNFFGGLIQYPLGNVSDLSSIFSIDAFHVLVGVGGGLAIGLAALLLKQGVYAIYAMLLWAIGVMFNLISTFFLAIPNTIGAFLPASTNPLAYTNGVFDPTVSPLTNPIIIFIGIIFAFGAWMYMFGLVIQRDQT